MVIWHYKYLISFCVSETDQCLKSDNLESEWLKVIFLIAVLLQYLKQYKNVFASEQCKQSINVFLYFLFVRVVWTSHFYSSC